MDTILSLIIQFISGAVGGNIAGAAKKVSLGAQGNSLVGGVGGVLLSQAMNYLSNGGVDAIANSHIVQQVLGSGGGGLILTAIIGAIKSVLNNNNNTTTRI